MDAGAFSCPHCGAPVEIDFKTRKLRVYPDYPDDTKHRLELSGFAKIEMTEAEFGYVFSAERR